MKVARAVAHRIFSDWTSAPARDRRRTGHRPPQWWAVAVGYALAFGFGAGYASFIKSFGEWDTGAAWERSAMLAIHASPPPALLALVIDAAPWVGTNLTLGPLIAVVALWLIVARKRRDLAAWLVVAELGCLTLNYFLKHAFVRERPDLWERVGWYGWASYPSGHTMASVAVLGTIALMLAHERGWLWPLAVVGMIAGLNAYGRIWHGVHWPSDVLAGAVVGLIWLLATAIAFDGLPKRRRADRPYLRWRAADP